jgi:hypothetical protein
MLAILLTTCLVGAEPHPIYWGALDAGDDLDIPGIQAALRSTEPASHPVAPRGPTS